MICLQWFTDDQGTGEFRVMHCHIRGTRWQLEVVIVVDKTLAETDVGGTEMIQDVEVEEDAADV